MHIAEIFHSIQGEGRLVGVPSVFVRTSGCNLRCWFCDTPYTSWQPEGEPWTVEALVEEVVEYGCEHVVLTGGEPMLQTDLVPLTQHLAAAGHHITIETAGTLDLPVQCDLMSISPKLSNSTPTRRHMTKRVNLDKESAGGGRSGRGLAVSPRRFVRQRGETASECTGGFASLRPQPTDEHWSARHDERRHRPEVIRRLTGEYDFQLKFVVDGPGDVAEIEAYLGEFPAVAADQVYLMPQAVDADTLREKSRWLAEIVKDHGWRLSPRLHVELWGNQRGV